MSIHPTRYENEKIRSAMMLTFSSSVSPGLIKRVATCGPARIMKRNAVADMATVAISTLWNMALILPDSPAP